MALEQQPPETDLWLPLPSEGQQLDPHTVHTHYFGFSVPEANLGGFIYIRYQPAFPLSQGGVCIFRGTDNIEILDAEHLDWQNTMRWPHIEGTTITTDNGLTVEFVELGREVRLRYESPDASFDLLQSAASPLVVRPHVMPGEAEHSDPESLPGGSEQFMHCTGVLKLHGDEFAVDCYAPRDRSWNQVRTERRGAVKMPPIAWTPMYFGPDLVFVQTGWEAPETNPPYLQIFPLEPGTKTHVFGWVHADGRTNEVVRTRREVHDRHPITHLALRQSMEAEDEEGRIFRFSGEALALSPVPAWPNLSFHDSVYRWEDEKGRVSYSSCQEAWFDSYQRLMVRTARQLPGART